MYTGTVKFFIPRSSTLERRRGFGYIVVDDPGELPNELRFVWESLADEVSMGALRAWAHRETSDADGKKVTFDIIHRNDRVYVENVMPA